jgi:hypothetical protein
MPTNDGLGSYDGYGVKDGRAATIQPNEQSTIGPPQTWSTGRKPLENLELMPQHQELGVAA